jgi:4'-phosphopantetheinyl transferase
MPASSASAEQNNSFSTEATASTPLPAFLSSCSDQVAASLLTLQENEVHIWWLRHHYTTHNFSTANNTDLGSTCAALLSPEEAAECATSKDPASQELRLIARAFTRTVLSRYVDPHLSPSSLIFERNEHGKPEMIHPKASLRFNLTHTPGLVGIAVTNGAAVGLDAESINRKTKGNALKLAQRRFAELEIEQLQRVKDDCEAQASLFIKLWTLKEAYVKAIGKGIGAPPGLRGFSFLLNESSSELIFDPKANRHSVEVGHIDSKTTTTWKFALMQPVEGHLAAVCCENMNDDDGKENRDINIDSDVDFGLRITSFLAHTDSSTGAELIPPDILAVGSSRK